LELSEQRHAPAALLPRKKPQVPVGWEAGGLLAGPDGMEELQFLTLQRLELQFSDFQPAVRLCTD
jgi:hypothetical protein